MVKLKLLRYYYSCNCGVLFTNRKGMVLHIKNLRKGKYRYKHFGADYTSNLSHNQIYSLKKPLFSIILDDIKFKGFK